MGEREKIIELWKNKKTYKEISATLGVTVPHVNYVISSYNKNKKKRSEQLCWTCQRACGGCNWSNFLRPVKDWTAKKVKRKNSDGTEYYTYKIRDCPEYIED